MPDCADCTYCQEFWEAGHHDYECVKGGDCWPDDGENCEMFEYSNREFN